MDNLDNKIAFKKMLKDLGWRYKDVSDHSGLTIGTVKGRICQAEPSWMKLAAAVYTATRIKYDLNIRKKVKRAKK